MRRLFGTNFFCCSGTRAIGEGVNTTFLSMVQNDPTGRDLEDELLSSDKSLRSDIGSSASSVSYSSKQSYREKREGLRPRTRDIFSEINKKRDNKITFAEFYSYLNSKGSDIDRSVAQKVFRKYDSSEAGYLTLHEFCKICPPDGNFPRAVQLEAHRVMKGSYGNQEAESLFKGKNSEQSDTSMKYSVTACKEYNASLNFLGSESSARSAAGLTSFYIPNDERKSKRGEHESKDYQEYIDSSSEDNPELMVLYARRTLRSSIYSNESPRHDELSRHSRAFPKTKNTVVKFLEDEEEDSSLSEIQVAKNLEKTPLLDNKTSSLQVSNMSSLVGLRDSVQPEEDERMAQRWEPLTVLEVGNRKKSPGTSDESHGDSLLSARSPDTSAGSSRIVQNGDKFLVHIDYGPLEISSKIAVERDKGVSYLKEVISRMKNTSSRSIRIRHRGRVITESLLTLEQLGLEHHPKLLVDLAGGAPLDEANRVVSINKRLLHETSKQLKDHAAYVCYKPTSRGAIERIKSGMAQKGWTIFDPESEELVSTNVKQLIDALNRCHIFLLFITRDIISDTWILLQILVAHKLGKEFHVVFETDPRLRGFAASSQFTKDIGKLLAEVPRNKIIPWSDKRYQQYEIFDYLAKQLPLYKNHRQSDTSGNTPYTSLVDGRSSLKTPIGVTSSLTATRKQRTVFKASKPMENKTTELKEVSLANSGIIAVKEGPERPTFKPTKNRLSTYKLIDKSGKFAFSITDMDTYLKECNVFLTSNELANLFSTISSRKQSTISMGEFIKYCPPNGSFPEKVWETIVQSRAS